MFFIRNYVTENANIIFSNYFLRNQSLPMIIKHHLKIDILARKNIFYDYITLKFILYLNMVR